MDPEELEDPFATDPRPGTNDDDDEEGGLDEGSCKTLDDVTT